MGAEGLLVWVCESVGGFGGLVVMTPAVPCD